MSQTNVDSKQKATMVGGCTYPEEKGTITMPPDQAKDFTSVENNIENGEFITISVSGKCDIREVLSPTEIEQFKAGRKENRPWIKGKQNNSEVEK